MHPPVEPQTSETLAHAVESLRRADRPLTGREILSAIPPPSRVDVSILEELLTKDSRVISWPARTKSGRSRYWIRGPEDVVDALLANLPPDAALTVGDLLKKVGRNLAGFSAKQRRALVESQVAALVAAGKLHVHPPPGRAQPKYGAKPAKAGTYLAKLKKSLDALAAKLAPAGITREQIVDALRGERPLGDLPQRIAEYLKAKPGGIGVAQMREDLGAPKADFDAAVLSLYRQRRVYLDEHDWPAGLTEAAKQQLVSDGPSKYYVVIGLRNADAESIP
jgi:hypothetical protein